MNNLEYITVDITKLKPLNEHRELEYGPDWEYGPNQHCRAWGGWSTFFETWDMLKKDITTPDKNLPVTARIEECWIERGWTHKELILTYKSVYPKECRELFKSFNENFGYLTELSSRSPIDVIIEGDGSIVVRNGNKRVSLLLWSGLWGGYPLHVKVYKRSDGWLQFKDEMFRLGENKQKIYHEIFHPDFVDWEILHPSVDRLRMITNDLHKVGDVRSILDFGCHTGFFAYNLADWRTVTAVDRSQAYINVAKSMGRLYGASPANPGFGVASIESIGVNVKYDAILFLSLFHDVLLERRERAFEIFLKLSNIAPVMYFDMRDEGEINKVIEKVISGSRYQCAKILGKSSLGRTMVRFSTLVLGG